MSRREKPHPKTELKALAEKISKEIDAFEVHLEAYQEKVRRALLELA